MSDKSERSGDLPKVDADHQNGLQFVTL